MLGHPWLELSVTYCTVAAAAVCSPSYTVAAAGVVSLVSTSWTVGAPAASGVVSPSTVQGPYINKEGMAFFALYMRRVKCTNVCTVCMCVYEQ